MSTNGGSAFRQVTTLPIHGTSAVAAATPEVWVIGSAESGGQAGPRAVLLRSGDAGRTWTTVHPEGEANWLDLGFTNPQQGVAISEGNVDKLLMTFDGGQTWAPVPTG